MNTETISIKKLKPNPANPRTIKDDKFHKLVQSVKSFPEMLKLRPIVVNDQYEVLGGNMRLRACIEAGMKEVTIIRASELTEDQQRRFIISDNNNFGSWDYDALANEWDAEELQEWGVDLPIYGGAEIPENENIKNAWIPDCIFPSNNVYEIPTLDMDGQADAIYNPVVLWGVDKRTRKIDGSTIFFYVDDYRFEAIWSNPAQVYETGCAVVCEPNVSMYDTTPVSYGLHLIYKKRWIARYLQTLGIKTLVDLNVSAKFAEYNLLGVPDGWNAFATRGYTERLFYLEDEIRLAQKISGKENPFMVVYGGGNKVREIVAKYNLIYIEQVRGFDKNKQENG